jgi:hypothetical protein
MFIRPHAVTPDVHVMAEMLTAHNSPAPKHSVIHNVGDDGLTALVATCQLVRHRYGGKSIGKVRHFPKVSQFKISNFK